MPIQTKKQKERAEEAEEESRNRESEMEIEDIQDSDATLEEAATTKEDKGKGKGKQAQTRLKLKTFKIVMPRLKKPPPPKRTMARTKRRKVHFLYKRETEMKFQKIQLIQKAAPTATFSTSEQRRRQSTRKKR